MIHPTLSNGAKFSDLTIGLFGGSFNPAHKGHLELSQYAIDKLGLDQVWWLVSPQNPLKSASETAPIAERISEALSISSIDPRITVTDLETQLGTTYTIETLRALKQIFDKTRFIWLMGSDNLEQFHLWHEWEEIAGTVPIAVFRRPGYAVDGPESPAMKRFAPQRQPVEQAKFLAHMKPPVWLIMDNPIYNISATEIRNKRNANKT